jgi:hypothetical protein
MIWKSYLFFVRQVREVRKTGQSCPAFEHRFIENKHFKGHEAGQKCPALPLFPTGE